MDVTRLTGALRAGDGRALTAREAGPAFESFLPPAGAERRGDDAAQRRDDRITRQHRAEAQRAEQHRAQERRDDARRLEERRAERRAEQKRADARRSEAREAEARRAEAREAEQREAEARQARRSEARRAEADRRDGHPLEPTPPRATGIELLASGRPDGVGAHGLDRGPHPSTSGERGSQRPIARSTVPGADARGGFAAAPGEAETSGAKGLAGLVQWLEGRSGMPEGPRAERAFELAAGDAEPTPTEGEGADVDPALLDVAEAADVEGEGDTAAELTRLLDGRRAGPKLEAPTRDGGAADTPRIGPRAEPPAGAPAPGPISPTARVADAAAAARAGSTPTALPEGVDESSIMRQISDALRLREGRIGRSQTAEIQLHPAELGRVRIKIHMEAGTARVQVAAEHAAVGDLLGAGLEQLRRDLMAQGVHVAHLEVRSGLAEDGGQRRDAPEREEADEREAQPEAPRPIVRRHRGRIDLEA